jgi:hypothetical protein
VVERAQKSCGGGNCDGKSSQVLLPHCLGKERAPRWQAKNTPHCGVCAGGRCGAAPQGFRLLFVLSDVRMFPLSGLRMCLWLLNSPPPLVVLSRLSVRHFQMGGRGVEVVEAGAVVTVVVAVEAAVAAAVAAVIVVVVVVVVEMVVVVVAAAQGPRATETPPRKKDPYAPDI